MKPKPASIGDLLRVGGVAAERPHQGARRACPARAAVASRDRVKSSVMRAPVLRVGLVARARRELARGRRGQLVALRIGDHAAMQVEAVRRELHQARARHLARFIPGDEVAPRHVDVAVAHRGIHRRIDPRADHRRDDGNAVRQRQRVHAGVEAAIRVVESDQHRASAAAALAPRSAAAMSSSETGVQPLARIQSKNAISRSVVTASLSSSSWRSTTSWYAMAA